MLMNFDILILITLAVSLYHYRLSMLLMLFHSSDFDGSADFINMTNAVSQCPGCFVDTVYSMR